MKRLSDNFGKVLYERTKTKDLLKRVRTQKQTPETSLSTLKEAVLLTHDVLENKSFLTTLKSLDHYKTRCSQEGFTFLERTLNMLRNNTSEGFSEFDLMVPISGNSTDINFKSLPMQYEDETQLNGKLRKEIKTILRVRGLLGLVVLLHYLRSL